MLSDDRQANLLLYNTNLPLNDKINGKNNFSKQLGDEQNLFLY